jgi:hypothetical protein
MPLIMLSSILVILFITRSFHSNTFFNKFFINCKKFEPVLSAFKPEDTSHLTFSLTLVIIFCI